MPAKEFAQNLAEKYQLFSLVIFQILQIRIIVNASDTITKTPKIKNASEQIICN